MLRRQTKIMERRSPGKLAKWADSQFGECCAAHCAPSKQDRRLATEPVNATKLAGLSVFEQE